MELHLMCGIPGSGKSTLAGSLSGYVVSTDRIREFLWQDAAKIEHDKLVFHIADVIINYMLSVRKDTIFDATNLTIKRRRKYIKLAKQYDALVTVHLIKCPLEVALERNSARDRKVPETAVRALYKSFQMPSHEEGMDVIKIYDEKLRLIKKIP